MAKKNGDLIRVKVLRRDGVVQNKWVTPKKFKTLEPVSFHHKHKAITAFVPGFKVSKKQPKASFRKLEGNQPKKVTLHIKITYNAGTADRFLDPSRELYLEAWITKEMSADQIHRAIPDMERDLKGRIQSKFFSNDSRGKLLSHPYYEVDDDFESGVEIDDITDSPSRGVKAGANYCNKGDLLKETTL
jgi:hypothetical protein